MSDLLLDERPIVVQPSLVRRLGMIEAAIVQQLHYWSARATIVHEGERYVYKTYQDWSDELGITAKQARGALDRLRTAGVAIGVQNPTDSRDRTLWWRIDYAALSGGDTDPGARSAPEGSSSTSSGQMTTAPAGTSTRASGCRSETTSETTGIERAQARGFRHGRAGNVSAEVAASAERVLDAFNHATGSRFKPRKRNGDPTPELKQVAGAMLDHEDVTEAEWMTGVRNMAANPPSWMDGPWIVGSMFGGKSSAHTIARSRPIAARDGGLAGGNVHPMPSRRLSGGAAKDGWGAADILRLAGVTDG